MQCSICKHGETYNGETTITLEKNNSTIVFKNVPALVCENCGEAYLSDEITGELLNLANEISKSGVEIDVRHFRREVA